MLSVDRSISEVDAIGIGRKGTIDSPQLLKAPFWTIDTLFFMTVKKGYDLEFVYSIQTGPNSRKAYRLYPYSELNDNLLKGYKDYYKKYMDIVTSRSEKILYKSL